MLTQAAAVLGAHGLVELCQLTGDLVGGVALVKFQVGRALQQLAHTLMLLHARKLQKDLPVVVLKHLDVGRYHAIGVDTAAEHVRGRVVHTVLNLALQSRGHRVVVLTRLYDAVEHHREVRLLVELAVFLYKGAHVVR